MTECNSFYNGGARGVSDSYASALWVIDYLFDRALGGAGPNLSATTGVTIQGASVMNDGTLSPSSAYTLTVSRTQLTCYVQALSAVMIQVV